VEGEELGIKLGELLGMAVLLVDGAFVGLGDGMIVEVNVGCGNLTSNMLSMLHLLFCESELK
jgi:hypothetical protein